MSAFVETEALRVKEAAEVERAARMAEYVLHPTPYTINPTP
jgi:hypothetical protein